MQSEGRFRLVEDSMNSFSLLNRIIWWNEMDYAFFVAIEYETLPLFCTSCRLDIQANCRKFNVEQNREYLNGPIDAHVTSQQVA